MSRDNPKQWLGFWPNKQTAATMGLYYIARGRLDMQSAQLHNYWLNLVRKTSVGLRCA